MSMRRFALRVLSFFRSSRSENELTREIDSHLQLLEDQFIARGMNTEDARLAARRAFGGQVEQTKERHRDARSFRVLDQSWLDIKLALRMLIRYPGLSLVSVLGMSVAIAISVGAFTLVNGLLDPTLPLPEGDRIVSLQNWDVVNSAPQRRSLHDFVAWRAELTTVDDVGAFREVGRTLIAAGVTPEVVRVAEISASAFRVARVMPLHGRYLRDDDEREGAPPVVVIAHELWKTRFASDPDIVGRRLQLGPTTHTIVGVMPEGFSFPVNHQVWVPFAGNPAKHERGDGPDIMVFGRLAPNATRETAQAELTAIGQQATSDSPSTQQRPRPQVLPYTHPFSDMDDPENALTLRVMQYLVSILLGIVCLNVAILVYARTATRQAEIRVRSALGAGRRRIVAQLFIEALALASLAAGVGLAIVAVALQQVDAALLQIIGQLPFWMDFSLSRDAIVYAFGLAIGAAAIVGVAPALKATGRHVQNGLKDVSAGSSMRLGKTWTALIVLQIAFAVALLPTVIYHVWDTATSGNVEPAFPAHEILTAQVSLDESSISEALSDAIDRELETRFADRQLELARRVGLEPMVAGIAAGVDSVGQEVKASIEVEGLPIPDESADFRAVIGNSAGYAVRFTHVDRDWFGVLGMPLLAGRTFSGADAGPGSTAVLVNQDFVRYILRNGASIGRRLRYVAVSNGAAVGRRMRSVGRADSTAVALGQWYEIVGIVAEGRTASLKPEVGDPKLYHPMLPGDFHVLNLAIRVRGADPVALTGRLREISAAVDPDLQLRRVMRMDDVLQQGESIFRLIALGLVLLTLSVVALSAAGIYALMSCTVEQRRKEIGIRAALGADPRRLLGAVFARTFRQLAVGGAAGIVVAVSLDALSEGDLMSGRGETVLPFVAILMVSVGLLAALPPARQGLRVNLTELLREQ
jgi:predicted permease